MLRSKLEQERGSGKEFEKNYIRTLFIVILSCNIRRAALDLIKKDYVSAAMFAPGWALY